MRQGGFWDFEEQLARLTKGGDPLVKLAAVLDFEPFRYRLEKALKRSDGAKGGRPPYDPVLMFKVLVLFDTRLKDSGYLAQGGQMGTSKNLWHLCV